MVSLHGAARLSVSLQLLVRLGWCSMVANDWVPFDRQEEDLYLPFVVATMDTRYSFMRSCLVRRQPFQDRHSKKKRSTACLCARKFFKRNVWVGVRYKVNDTSRDFFSWSGYCCAPVSGSTCDPIVVPVHGRLVVRILVQEKA